MGGPGGCWRGGRECSPGCRSQVPLDHPVKRMPGSVLLPQPTGHCGHGHVPAPAMGLFPRAGWIQEGGQPEMSLPPAQNVALPPAPKSGKAPLSSARSDVAMPMPMPYLGPSWALGPWWASAALQRTRGHYVGAVLAGGTGQGGCSGTAWSLHCHPTPAPWGYARPGGRPPCMTVPCTWHGVAPYRRSWGSWVSLAALKEGRDGVTAGMGFPQWVHGVSPGRADPDSASSSGKHPCQVRTSLASSWQDAWGQALTQAAGWPPRLHPEPAARSPPSTH